MSHVIPLALGLLAVYIVTCLVWPFASCRKCGGTGRFASPSGRAWRDCRRCDGRGRRLRTGYRVLRALRSFRGD